MHNFFIICQSLISCILVTEDMYLSLHKYFINEYINSPRFRVLAENASTGSTRNRIGLDQLRNIKISCPSLSEQTRIAEILSDMDTEIETLKSRLAKYQQMKQGMMQELLTGKTRLV